MIKVRNKVSPILFFALINVLLMAPASNSATEEYLLSIDMNRIDNWNNNASQLVPKLAQIQQVRYRIPSSNPDKLIAQIVLSYSLADKQAIYDSKWNLGLWIYGQPLNCLDQENCDFIHLIRPQYPKSVSISTWAKSYKKENKVISDCPGNSSLETTPDGKLAVVYTLSITCLNIPKQFVSYAFTSYTTGLDPEPFGFTSGGYVDNPFYQLAKKAYDANGGKQGVIDLGKSVALEKFESAVQKARDNFDNLNYRYQSLASETQTKLDKNKDWKNFQLMEEQLTAIENNVTSSSLTDNQILAEVPKVMKIVNSQISAIKILLKLIPTYQCYNEEEDLTTVLTKSKTCPKGFKKVKT